jgi:cytochrome c
MTRRTLLLALALFGVARTSRAQNVPDLKQAPDSLVVSEAHYCRGKYRLTFADRSERDVMEMNLRMKTDSGSRGPHAGRPVVLPSGMRGDRFFLIFASPEEISAFLTRC